MFGIIWIGGLGEFQDLTTLYAMINVGPTILSTLLNNPPFNLRGGCKTFYAGMKFKIISVLRTFRSTLK